MVFYDIILFLLRYIPFWAVPLGLISAHFTYLYWLKDYRDIAYFWAVIVLFCLTLVAVFLLMGGPDQIGSTITHIIH